MDGAVTDKMIGKKSGGIGHLIFNNPAKHNAVTFDMWKTIPTIIDDFEGDPDIRVIVVSGAGGKAFVSGADISEFKDRRASADGIAAYNVAGTEARRRITDSPKPTIAMIRGYCLGGGMGVAMACDIRIAAEGAKFGIPAAKLSVGYAPAGIGTLMSLVGPSMVKDIFYSARQLSAEEALRVGLVNQVIAADALDAHVEDYANTIAGNAPLTIAAVKKAVAELLKDEKDRDIAAAERAQAACFASQDYLEGQAAFAEKRKPKFHGR